MTYLFQSFLLNSFRNPSATPGDPDRPHPAPEHHSGPARAVGLGAAATAGPAAATAGPTAAATTGHSAAAAAAAATASLYIAGVISPVSSDC